MNSEDKNNHLSDWETCAVCGESVEPGRGASRINHRGNTINFCGPTCLQVFAQEPDPYIARLAKRMRELVLRESLRLEALGLGPDGVIQAAVPHQIMGPKRETSVRLAKPCATP